MDAAFLLDDAARANFLQIIMQSFGCTYICLWSYLPHPSNCLFFKDGFYHEENGQQPSSSSGTLAQRLFDDYRQSVFTVENDRVPGLAFKNSFPYLEIKELDLQRLASIQTQWQFYQEARIKTVAFMGCKSGEIEIGFSNVTQQINMEMEMRKWFPEDFQRQSPLGEVLPQPTDPNRPSSSSSSLRSLSMESGEYPPLLFSIPSTSYMPETLTEAPIEHPPLEPILSSTTSPHQQAIQTFTRIRNIPFLTPESEDAAMTRAILAVISSPSSSSSSHHPLPNLPYNIYRPNLEASAFKNYSTTSALAPTTQQTKANLRRQSMLKRAVSYLKSINSMRIREQMQGISSRPTGTQLHHMISERKRREKLNESFHALRTLLPPGSKKDKASVLASTREHLSSLKAQVSELSRRNQLLEAQLLPLKEATEEVLPGSSNERLDVRITQVSESTSEERIIDLRVTVRSDCQMLDLSIRILEFLKQVKNIGLMSMEAETHLAESSSVYRVVLRLRIEGTEWDESAFQEAVRRVVADLAQ